MLNGIDVSNLQGAAFDWAAWKGRIQFAGIKVSEGTTFADPDAARNMAGARLIGAARMAYHFLHPSEPAAAQAAYFIRLAKIAGLGPGDLTCLDYEASDGLPPDHCAAAAATFAGAVHAATGAWPVTYVNQDFAAHYCTGLDMTPLWLANPSQVQVPVTGPWKLISFEQRGQRGVDTDVFYGDLAELARLAIPHPAPPPKPPVPRITPQQAEAAIAGAEGAMAQFAVHLATLAEYVKQG